jgi:5-formyltetrahydrofolate cyclo-ligase
VSPPGGPGPSVDPADTAQGARGLRQAKRRLRAEIRDARLAVPEAERSDAALAIAERVLALPEVRLAGAIMLFSSFGSEVSTEPLARMLLARGARLLLPFLADGEMHASAFDPAVDLVSTAYGPGEPPGPIATDPSEIDVVVVPALALDRSGNRVGYGRGYYDRYLRTVRPDALRVGICFAVQLVDLVPHGPGDERVDVVVTEVETVFCRRGP